MSTKKQIAPIGIFDSGYGGLTVLSSIAKQLPEYDLLYLGDNARTPYGTRPFDVVYNFTLQGVQYLFDQGAELVILACNTASAKALRTIQVKDLPRIAPNKRVLGVIRPTAEILGQHTSSKHVGVFGTEGTINSGSYPVEIKKFSPEVVVSQEACPMWVPLIESNSHQTTGGKYFVELHVNSILSKDDEIDLLVLGCTHYPILIDELKSFLPKHVKVLEQGEIVANSLEKYLHRHPEMADRCSKGGEVQFCTTADPEQFQKKAELILGYPIEVQQVEI